MDNAIDNYQAVLRDLEVRRSRCQAELAEIDTLIAGIKKVMAKDASLFVGSPATATIARVRVTQPPPQPTGKFAGMSVRWAVLNFLSDNEQNHGAHPTTAEIAQALRDGGIESKGQNFNSNVSAILSVMASKRQEVATAGGAWALTETGRATWAAIKTTPQYQSRFASEQPTLQ